MLQAVEDLGLPASNTKRLKMLRSDLWDYHSIIEALKGCSALFYCFEPPSDHPSYDVCFTTSSSSSFTLLLLLLLLLLLFLPPLLLLGGSKIGIKKKKNWLGGCGAGIYGRSGG